MTTRSPRSISRLVAFVVTLAVAGACSSSPSAVRTSTTSAPAAGSSTSNASGITSTTTATSTVPATTTTTVCVPVPPVDPWSVARLAAQTIAVPTQETDVATASSAVAQGVGGIILFGRAAPADLGASLAHLDAAAPDGIAPFVMSDEEGGSVQRMANLVGAFPAARVMAATMTAAAIERLAHDVGVRLRRAGVTMDLAPVLDLDGGAGPNTHDAIGPRSFSTDPATATADGEAFARGLMAAGVVPVVKHFPGLGDASANTDVQAASTRPWSELQARGLLPFASAIKAGVPAVMVSNASVPGLTTLPASLSSNVMHRTLKDTLGFTGLVITDALGAGAIQAAGFDVPQATVQALVAGADMVVFGPSAGSPETVMRTVVPAIEAAVASGRLSRERLDDAVEHVLTAKHAGGCHAH